MCIETLTKQHKELNRQLSEEIDRDTQRLKEMADDMAECATNIKGHGYSAFITAREQFNTELERFRRCWSDFLYK